MPLNPFELVVALLFHSFAMLRRHWIHWTTFEALSLHVLMSCSFWWSSAFDELTSDELQLLMNSLLMTRHHFRSALSSRAIWLQEQFFSDAFKLPFCWLLCSLLFFQNLLIISKILSMVLYTWTDISKSNWQFFNTLLSSKLLRAMLNTFCSNKIHVFSSNFPILPKTNSGQLETEKSLRKGD